MLFTRGSTLRSTLEYLEHALPPAERAAVLARLSPADQALIASAAVTDDVPYRVALDLWRSADLALAPVDPQWAEHAGAEAIRLRGMQLYSGLLLKPTPEEFLAQHISLFQRYYRPGDGAIDRIRAGRPVVLPPPERGMAGRDHDRRRARAGRAPRALRDGGRPVLRVGSPMEMRGLPCR